MISYSERARKALTYLFRPYNDIDIYVEDKVNRAMYQILLQRMAGNRVKINRIHQLGGKSAVIEECSKNQSKGRPRLYIIDGDLDLLTGEPAPRLKHFVRLGVYCAENLLITEDSLTEIAFESALDQERNLIGPKLAFPTHIAALERAFLPLFLVYAVAHKLKVGVPTVAHNVQRLVANVTDDVPCPKKVRVRMRELRKVVIAKEGGKRYLNCWKAVVKQYRSLQQSGHQVISGKDYLLPLLHKRLRRLFDFKEGFEQLKPRLARHSDIRVDPKLLAAVKGIK